MPLFKQAFEFETMKRFSFGDQGEADGINMHVLISRKRNGLGDRSEYSPADRPVFECKTCNRQFSSFQALGGHRASHKRPRLADGGHGLAQGAPGKPRVHECSICGVVFAIGQALGGHMRRHRGASNDGHVDDDHGLKSDGKKVGGFDLNLPPSDESFDCRVLGFGLDLGLGLEYVR